MFPWRRQMNQTTGRMAEASSVSHTIQSGGSGGGGGGHARSANASNMVTHASSSDWLGEILDEVGLSQFHTKLTNDLQLTRLSHFDFVSEDDLINIGMSRPAAKRLLASIRKKKSLVTAIKNKIVNKLLPLTNSTRKSSSPTLADMSLSSSSSRSSSPTSLSFLNAHSSSSNKNNRQNRESSQLTCLINTQDVQIKEQIGHGVHGVVKKGLWTAPNGRAIEVALKILKNDILPPPTQQQHENSHSRTMDSFSDFVKEINVMHKLNHPNLIKLYGVVLSTPMMMVTELAPYGNLRDKLRKENGHTSISLLINFGVQIASGMEYLESKRLVHRDLATRNIFISHNRKIKIGDFGLMRAIPQQEEHYIMNETTRIPFPWCAPESLRLKRFSSASDTYMYAVTLWEMFSFGREPWEGLSGWEILGKIDKGERLAQPEACPTVIYQIMMRCWESEPYGRPTFSALTNYISTTFPLELKAIRALTPEDIDQFYPPLNPGAKVSEDLLSVSTIKRPEERRKILPCAVEDHILCIDGQPEDYWWKGQNQRTMTIGWFPLNCTQWVTQKKAQHYISKPLKNSFIHTGHSGPDGTWGDPRSIDQMYLKNPLTTFAGISDSDGQLPVVKLKNRSKLSRLFGINEPSSTNNCSQPLSDQKSYQKLFNDTHNVARSSKRRLFHNIQRSQSQDIPTNGSSNKNRTQTTGSNSQSKLFRDEPPLIDFSDEIQIATENINNSESHGQGAVQSGHLKASRSHESLHRRLSDTNLRVFGDRYSNVSQTGSWNTGTFDDAYSNNYSKYYCPQDAVIGANSDSDAYHYYSAVPYVADVTTGILNSQQQSLQILATSQTTNTTNTATTTTTTNTNTSTTPTTTTTNTIGPNNNSNGIPINVTIMSHTNQTASHSHSTASHATDNTPLSHHSFPVTFDDSSFEEPSSSSSSGINNSSKQSVYVANQPEINPNSQLAITNNDSQSQQPQQSEQIVEPKASLLTLSGAANQQQLQLQQTTENPTDHASTRLSKEFIRSLEDELGISPGRPHIDPPRSVPTRRAPTVGVAPLPPPPTSAHGGVSRQCAKVSQVAIVAPNMTLANIHQSRPHHLLNGVPSSREQRLVNIIQKRCSGDVSVQTCLEALRRNNLDHELAIREIQVNRLMSLEITKDRNRCERALISTNWKLESAASRLLDETL